MHDSTSPVVSQTTTFSLPRPPWCPSRAFRQNLPCQAPGIWMCQGCSGAAQSPGGGGACAGGPNGDSRACAGGAGSPMHLLPEAVRLRSWPVMPSAQVSWRTGQAPFPLDPAMCIGCMSNLLRSDARLLAAQPWHRIFGELRLCHMHIDLAQHHWQPRCLPVGASNSIMPAMRRSACVPDDLDHRRVPVLHVGCREGTRLERPICG